MVHEKINHFEPVTIGSAVVGAIKLGINIYKKRQIKKEQEKINKLYNSIVEDSEKRGVELSKYQAIKLVNDEIEKEKKINKIILISISSLIVISILILILKK